MNINLDAIPLGGVDVARTGMAHRFQSLEIPKNHYFATDVTWFDEPGQPFLIRYKRVLDS